MPLRDSARRRHIVMRVVEVVKCPHLGGRQDTIQAPAMAALVRIAGDVEGGSLMSP